MRSVGEIKRRMAQETDAFVIQALGWVLEDDCPVCNHKKCRELEIKLHNNDTSPDYLETKYGWPDGSVMTHMESHLEYAPDEAQSIEDSRKEAIDTLTSATEIFLQVKDWIGELGELKEQAGGINSGFVADVTKLLGQANASLKLIGQLKKEIGVESQLLLANAQMNDMSRILVDVLGNHPELLDDLELRMASLRAPKVIDVDYTVTENEN